MNKLLVSIIVVNCNGGLVFRNCLESLDRIVYPTLELVIVDNGSFDESLEIVDRFFSKRKNVKVLKNSKNVGFAVANNQGFEISKGKYILLLNNDTKVPPNFLDKMVEKMEIDRNIGVLQPKIRLMDKKNILDNAGAFITRIGFLKHHGFMEKDREEFNMERLVFSVKGACLLARRKAIESAGGLFDPDFV